MSTETTRRRLAGAKSRAKRFANKNRRNVQEESASLEKLIIAKFDASLTGGLNRDEVRKLCETIMNEVTPGLGEFYQREQSPSPVTTLPARFDGLLRSTLASIGTKDSISRCFWPLLSLSLSLSFSLCFMPGGVTDEDVDTVMRVGGDNAKPEITAEELPKALAIVMSLKRDNFRVHDLFDKHDKDKSGKLPKEQLVPLLTDLNEGIIPVDADVDFVIAQCDLSGDGCVERAQIKGAIACWWVRCEETLPLTVADAKAAGYSDEVIAEFQADEAAYAAEAAREAENMAPAGAAAEEAAPAAAAEAAPAAAAAAGAETTA